MMILFDCNKNLNLNDLIVINLESAINILWFIYKNYMEPNEKKKPFMNI